MKCKRFNAFFLAVIIVCSAISLSACKSGGGSKTESGINSGGAGNVTANKEVDYFSNVPEKLDGTTVKFATWIDHTRNESGEVLADFTNLTGIKVELVDIPQMEYCNKIAALIASDQAPDVIVDNSDWPATLQLLMPLDDTILDTTDTFWDQEVVKRGTIGGRPYLVNVKGGAWDLGGSSLVIYNKRMFEDNGITTPDLYMHEGRWTLENFFKCAKELAEIYESGVGIDPNPFINTYSGGLVKYDTETGTYSNNCTAPDVVSAWQMMAEARDGGYALVRDDGFRDHFEKEALPMLFTGSYGLRKSGWFNEMDVDDVGYILPPKKDSASEQPYGAKSLRAYGISRGAKNPDGAAYFLRYFLNMDNYDETTFWKNEEAGKLYLESCENASSDVIPCANSVMQLVAADPMLKATYHIFPDLQTCTASQVSTVLSRSSNSLDACVKKANEIVQKVITANPKH